LRVESLLEIGVLNGGSLEIWAQFFPEAKRILGCDIEPRCQELAFDDPRISVVIGDAASAETAVLIKEIVSDFDLVVDDGSHTSRDIILNFCRYFPMLRDGGVYVVEDLHCSYWESYGGGLYHPGSAMAFFKALADVINGEHWGNSRNRTHLVGEILSPLQGEIAETELERVHTVEFANSMCFVRKERSDLNRLGRHLFAGRDCPVWSPPTHGKLFAEGDVPDQTANPWSAADRSPRNLLQTKLELVQANLQLKSELAGIRQSLWWRAGAPWRYLRGLFGG